MDCVSLFLLNLWDGTFQLKEASMIKNVSYIYKQSRSSRWKSRYIYKLTL